MLRDHLPAAYTEKRSELADHEAEVARLELELLELDKIARAANIELQGVDSDPEEIPERMRHLGAA